MEKIEIAKSLKDAILKDIEELSVITESDRNINYLLPRITKFQLKIRMIPEFKNNPNNTFGTYLIYQILGTIFLIFGDKTEKWYKMNEKGIKKIRKEVSSYFNALRKGIKEESLDQIVNASKIYLYNSGEIYDDIIVDFPSCIIHYIVMVFSSNIIKFNIFWSD